MSNLDPSRRGEITSLPTEELAGMAGQLITTEALQAEETREGYATAEFVAAREQYWTRRDGRPVVLGCGDEGAVNDTSARVIAEDYPEAMDVREGMLSVYGQVAGLTKVFMVAGIAHYGPDFIRAIETGDGFQGLFGLLSRRMQADTSYLAVRPALHSAGATEFSAFSAKATPTAESIENTESLFCSTGNHATGCAYCGGVGATSHLIATNTDVQGVALDNIAAVTGINPEDDAMAKQAIEANRLVAEALGADFCVDRQAYVDSGLPVMVLKRAGQNDKHLEAAKTGVIMNLNPLEVRNASGAHNNSEDFYGLDVAGTTLLLRRMLREYDVPAAAIAKAVIADQASVRTVLAMHDASSDKTPDPRRLALGIRGGTFQGMLEQIAELERA